MYDVKNETKEQARENIVGSLKFFWLSFEEIIRRGGDGFELSVNDVLSVVDDILKNENIVANRDGALIRYHIND